MEIFVNTRFTIIEKHERRKIISAPSLIKADRKLAYFQNSSLNARIDPRLSCIRSLVFCVSLVCLSIFLYYQVLLSIPYFLSYADASQTLAGILRYTPSSSFLHASLPSCPSSELLLSFWWRDSALCHACLEFPFCPLFFPLARGFDSSVLVPISHDRKVPTIYSADFAEKISRNDFDNNAKMEIYGDDLRILSAFPRFPLSHYSATFHFPSLYRYTYQLGRLKSRLSVIHFRYLSKARLVRRIVNRKYISNW